MLLSENFAHYNSYWNELRWRVFVSFASFLLAFLFFFYWRLEFFSFLVQPLAKINGSARPSLVVLKVWDGLYAMMDMAMYASFLCNLPFFIFQLWKFVVPAMYKNERIPCAWLLFCGGCLFYIGVVFCWFFVVPVVFSYAIIFLPSHTLQLIDVHSYVSMLWSLALVSGLILEIPVFIVLLLWFRQIDFAMLKFMRPYYIVCCFIAAMVLTPPDMIAQIMLAIPLCLIFEIGIFVGYLLCMWSRE